MACFKLLLGVISHIYHEIGSSSSVLMYPFMHVFYKFMRKKYLTVASALGF